MKTIQWYPGHMTKARRMMEDQLKLVDLIIEILDARIPVSSRNPDIDSLGRQKSRFIVLNKSDLADERANEEWIRYYESLGYVAAAVNGRSSKDMKLLQQKIREASEAKRERDRKRGILNRPVRAMVAGIPNVGKSTVINTLAGRASAKTGDKPGVTRGKQWIRLNPQVELLDTPGILWPKFENPEVGMHLAWTGSVRDEILTVEEVAASLIEWLTANHPGAIRERYGVAEEGGPHELLEKIGIEKNWIMKGNQPDIRRTTDIVLDDFRGGRLGRFTIEKPEDFISER